MIAAFLVSNTEQIINTNHYYLKCGSMKIFVWLTISVSLLSILLRLYLLSTAEYPRVVKWKRSEDAIGIIMSAIWITYGLYLLFVV